MTMAELESRLAALEQRVEVLSSVLPPHLVPATNKRWIDAIWGSFANDPAFDEAMKLGRKWRESEDAPQRRPKKTRK
jgi:hypothetical protein